LQRRGFPTPIAVCEVLRCELNGRALRWIEFPASGSLAEEAWGKGWGMALRSSFLRRWLGHSVSVMVVTSA
jgi:hypothetical protein